MFKFLTILIIMVNILFADKIDFSKGKCDNIENFNNEQILILLKSYLWGNKYDLGYTLAAISWLESCAGLYQVNLQDPSAGLYHTTITSVMNRHKEIYPSEYNKNRLAHFLVKSDRLAAKEALKELLYWKNYYSLHKKSPHNNEYNGIWKSIIKSYNKGTKWLSSDVSNQNAENYFNSINQKVILLKKFFENNDYVNKIKMIENKINPIVVNS